MEPVQTAPLMLVIDDEAPIHRAFERCFSRGGFRVLGAEDGDIGLDLARTEMPDVILLDVNMPRLDGRDVLMRLQSDAQLKSIPVVVISSRVDHYLRVQMLEDGAEDVVEKPFDPVIMARRLTWIIEKRRADVVSN